MNRDMISPSVGCGSSEKIGTILSLETVVVDIGTLVGIIAIVTEVLLNTSSISVAVGNISSDCRIPSVLTPPDIVCMVTVLMGIEVGIICKAVASVNIISCDVIVTLCDIAVVGRTVEATAPGNVASEVVGGVSVKIMLVHNIGGTKLLVDVAVLVANISGVVVYGVIAVLSEEVCDTAIPVVLTCDVASAGISGPGEVCDTAIPVVLTCDVASVGISGPGEVCDTAIPVVLTCDVGISGPGGGGGDCMGGVGKGGGGGGNGKGGVAIGKGGVANGNGKERVAGNSVPFTLLISETRN